MVLLDRQSNRLANTDTVDGYLNVTIPAADQLNVALVTIGGLTLVLSLAAGFVQRRATFVSEPMLAVGLGVLLGPAGLSVLRLSAWGDPFVILEQTARLTVGLAVMAAALRLPRRYVQDHWRSMAAILGPGMIGMWLVSGAIVYWLLDLPFWVALLVGAVLTPTDPVLAGTIVTGDAATENIPAPVRHVLTGESGANDGLAYPLVFLPVLALEHEPRRVLTVWLRETLLWEVVFALVVGGTVGALVGIVETWSRERAYLDETSLLSLTVALTFVLLGAVKLLGSDGILAAFAAGLAFTEFADAIDEAAEQKIQETVLRLFTFPVFVFFGTMLPWTQWIELGWIGVVVAIAVLLLRRAPMLLVFDRWTGPLGNWRRALFAGWFGPIGIAALFYAVVTLRTTGIVLVWVVCSLVIASSILAHGVTSTPATRRFGRVTGSVGGE